MTLEKGMFSHDMLSENAKKLLSFDASAIIYQKMT